MNRRLRERTCDSTTGMEEEHELLFEVKEFIKIQRRAYARWRCTRSQGEAAPLQFGVLGLGLLQDGDVGVGILPQGEEIIVGGTGFRSIALQRIGAGEPEMGERAQRAIHDSRAVINEFAEFGAGFVPLVE